MHKTRQVEQIDKHNFIKVVINKNSKIFVLYVAALKVLTLIAIYLF